MVPSFVASPSSTAEASALMRAAAEAGLAVVPRGAGTGLAWGAPPARCDLVVDMRSMDQVIEHAAGDLVARVQAGATIGQLAAVLASAGQQLALDAPNQRDRGRGGRHRHGRAAAVPLRRPARPADRSDRGARRWGDRALRRQGGQERGRLRPRQALLRVPGHAGADHRGDLPASSAAGRGGVGDRGVRACGPGRRGRGGGRRRRGPRWCPRPWSWTGRAGRSGRCGSGCYSRARRPGSPNGPSSCPSCWLPRADRRRWPMRRRPGGGNCLR